MATSNSINWSTTRNEIIRAAALDLYAIGAGVTMGAQMLQDFNYTLNAMVKALNASGIHVWTVTEATLFPQADTAQYTVGTSGTAHVTDTYYSTTISASEATGQTVLSITSNTNMTAADNIGIVVDDGTIHWTTISSSTSTTVTIAVALDDDASAGNYVFWYTNKINRPLRIVDARRHNYSTDNDTPIDMIARLDYQWLPQKNQTGSINNMFYDPQLGTGKIYLWQPVSTVEDLVKFTYHRSIEDFDAAGDNPDLPVEWVMALRYNLAKAMIPQYPACPKPREIKELAAEYLDLVTGHDREVEAISFGPDMMGY